MKRDLVFFVAGLSFGVCAGYFAFRAVSSGDAGIASPPAASNASAETGSMAGSAGPAPSTIGLDNLNLNPNARDGQPQLKKLDEEQVRKLEAKAGESANDVQSRAELGRLYMESGKYPEAVRWLEEAVKLAPDDLHLRNHLAICYLNEGHLDQAVSAFEENLSRDPNHAPSLLGLGRVKLYLQRDIQGGLAMWERLVQVAPNSPEATAVRDELQALKSAHPGS
jgi:tetratricopeptide (TPR) repeat protein